MIGTFQNLSILLTSIYLLISHKGNITAFIFLFLLSNKDNNSIFESDTIGFPLTIFSAFIRFQYFFLIYIEYY